MRASLLIVVAVVLIVMTVGIGLFINYHGGDWGIAVGPSATEQTAPATDPELERRLQDRRELAFESTNFPVPGDKDVGKEWELKKSGYADFWFSNPHDAEIRCGVRRKTCKCTDIEMFLSNPEWDALRKRNLDVGAAAAVAGPIATLYVQRQQADMHRRESQLTRYNMNEPAEDGFPVPAHARGWVRLTWSGEHTGTAYSPVQNYVKILIVDLWSHHRSNPLNQVLNIKLYIYPVLHLLDTKQKDVKVVANKTSWEVYLGEFSHHQLPREISLVFTCSTRTSVDFKAAADKVLPHDGADLFVVGRPVQVGADELLGLPNEGGKTPYLCAYRVPITLLDRSGDRLCDAGSFRRTVKLTVADEDIDPIEVPVTGTVEGDVQVGVPEDKGTVSFGIFDGKRTQERKITLFSDTPDLELQLLPLRQPSYLTATITKNKQPADAVRQTWKLTVTIPPGKVNGPFPRDDPAYQDSAVYVKATGGGTRVIRIPVQGNVQSR